MKNILLFLPLLLLLACTSDQKPSEIQLIPADSIIPEELMVLILADVHFIEAAMVIERNRGKNANSQADFYYAGLFEKYKISRKRYQQNLEYYRDDPDTFHKLYEKVIKELTEREENFVKASRASAGLGSGSSSHDENPIPRSATSVSR